MLAGGDCIDDADLLRCGATSRVLGHRVMAPSTLGTSLRAFTFRRAANGQLAAGDRRSTDGGVLAVGRVVGFATYASSRPDRHPVRRLPPLAASG